MTGGSLIATNFYGDGVYLGTRGLGQMMMSNGTTSIDEMDLENGTFTLAGGSCTMSLLTLGEGTVWMTGGQLSVTGNDGAEIDIGGVINAEMIVSNGTMTTDLMRVVGIDDTRAILTVAGGTRSVLSNLTIGFFCPSPGTVIVAGGSLFATNAAHNAVLELDSGTVSLSGGMLVADILVTNSGCTIFFQQTGGTLVIGRVTNVMSSPFNITAISRVGNDMRISWQTPAGVTNAVQATNGGPGGSYNTNFVNLSTSLMITGTGLVTTNYLDVGGATNTSARYYRVRHVP